MSEVAEATDPVRFPFISLSRAIERAREINKNAGPHPILASEAKKLWGYTEKASGGFQTTAALKYYGLVLTSGLKDRRQLKLTSDARRYFLDERPEIHEELIKKFALHPVAFAKLWEQWKSTPPTDPVARSTLKVNFGYAENAAAELLALYKTNLAFAKLLDVSDDSRTAGAKAPDEQELPLLLPPSPATVEVGDYVQWCNNGQDQFSLPRKVTWVSEDGSHARVFSSMTGVPTSELTVTDPPKPPLPGQSRSASGADAGIDGELSVLLRGNRLEIAADVDRAGLTRLKEILTKYEEILDLLGSGSVSEGG